MLESLFEYLKPAIRFCIRFPLIVLGTGFLLAAVGLLLALNLRIDNDFSKLLPESYPSVQSLEKLREQVGTPNEVAVIIKSTSFELNKEFAERLIPEVMKMKNRSDDPYFSRVLFRKETDFLKSNALWFATDQELSLIESYLDEEIELARMRANPFYFELDDDTAASDSLGNEFQQAYDELIGSEYPISADSLTMAVRFYPAGSQTDIRYIRELYEDLEILTTQLAEEFGQADLTFVLAGRLLRSLIEIDSIYLDVRDSFWAGTIMLLLLVMGYFFYKNYHIRTGGVHSLKIFVSELFRLPVTALIMAVPLVVSLCWTFGITWLTFETLNIMTSTLGLLLFGMGIDFGIHFYARYIEERGEGNPVEKAIETTFMTTGQAIAAVGITTSAAFFILMIADFKGFSEFGAIAGIGLLFSIFSMIFLLPALIILLEKMGLLKTLMSPVNTFQKKDINRISKPNIDRKILATGVILICLAATILSGWHARGLDFEYDFGKLEPVYESYNIVAQEARKVYSDRKTRNAAYIIADNPEDAIELRNVLSGRISSDTLTSTIESVEIFQDRYPFSDAEQQQKLARIEGVRERLDDTFIRTSDSEQFHRLKQAASTVESIHLEQVPDFLLEPFTAKDGSIGNLVIIYPSVPLSDGRNSMNFADDLSNIHLSNGKIYNAASTSIVASDMLRLMIHETPRMVAITLTFIILIKLIIFRSVKWMVLALLPLAASFLWLFGFMEIAGWKLNFYNIVVLPTILGIGDDSGIHIIHRYIEEGRGSIYKVIRSTGEHVTVSSLTTMLGFAGLLFSTHPGMRSIGELAVAGIGLMLFASLVLLPAVLYILERWSEIRIRKVGQHKKDR
jgi:uncharacterized protein